MISYSRSAILFVLLVSGLLPAIADDQEASLSQLQKPPRAAVTDSDFARWAQVYKTKQSKVKQLLEDAGIDSSTPLYLNSLINNYSPYLLRHSVNPVNWTNSYAQALNTAKQRQKLIFISIGYSTCHWCHVMEKESFLDIDVAHILNTHFINIKLDKEIDGDLDRAFSYKQQVIKGESGWPLNAILTPDGKLFWTDAYVNKQDFLNLLSRVSLIWQQRPERISLVADNLEKQFTLTDDKEPSNWDDALLFERLQKLEEKLDPKYGGLRGNIKFPNASLIELMMYQYQINLSPSLKQNITHYLDSMVDRGLWDSINGGFFRYAQSSSWQKPHFEKMLYNQALLISVYAKASRLFQNPRYAQVAHQIYSFSQEWLSSDKGGYYSAIDADYNGQQGAYYLFSSSERKQINHSWEAQYQWSTSKNLGMMQVVGFIPSEKIKNSPHLIIKQSLPKPHIDKKILTAWNALMAKGLMDAYLYSGETGYLEQAIRTLDYLLKYHFIKGKLFRSVIDDMHVGSPTLEDYAWFSQVLYKAHMITNKQDFLSHAIILYKKGVELLEQLQGEVDWLNDQEFISPITTLVHTGQLLSMSGHEKKSDWKVQLNSLKQRVSKREGNYFSSYLLMLNQIHGSYEPIQKFARGNGTAFYKSTNEGALIEINMAPSWHVNSHKPLEKNLIGTQVTSDSNWALNITYPEPTIKKLNFSNSPLSLYENKFSISIVDRENVIGDKIRLLIQACSDKLCLFPEELTFSN